MQPQYLLDTNICIYIRQKKPERLLLRFENLRSGEAIISVITYDTAQKKAFSALTP
jgi:tRNA(fMet)-specific endonuclease VapC